MNYEDLPKTGLAFAFTMLLIGIVAVAVLYLALIFLRAMVPTEM